MAAYDRGAWCRALYSTIALVLPQLSVASKLMVLAQAAYESGWGKAKAARLGNNLFNITSGPAWKGPIILGGDTEYDAQGNVKNITQKFRSYPTFSDSIRDYWKFLGGPRYLAARNALVDGDSIRFVNLLYAGGYFTLPPDRYLASFQSILVSVQGLASV